MDLHGQRVVILGGTSGIGLATAKAAARCCGRPTSPTRPWSAALFGDLGDIDHLVFTAGEPLALMNLAALDLDKAREFFALRYFGALWAVHAAAPHLQPGGSIT